MMQGAFRPFEIHGTSTDSHDLESAAFDKESCVAGSSEVPAAGS
jgi:hypothetical protein